MDNTELKKKFLGILQSCLAIYDKSAKSETVFIWWKLLSPYQIVEIEEAFARYLASPEGRFPPKPASIIEIINAMNSDGRPGPDEAWALIPKDEYASAVITDEMASALRIAQPLLDAGDKIAARMAFREAYLRIVDQNKLNGIKPIWFPSLGHDKSSHEAALADAVRLGRLGTYHAIGLLPPDMVAPMLLSAGKDLLALDYKMPSNEEALQRIKIMKEMLM